MALRLPELAASVPFYGSQPAAGDMVKIQAPLLLHYGELDKRINHGFLNDTTPRYDKTQAELAWNRTVKFFKEKLA